MSSPYAAQLASIPVSRHEAPAAGGTTAYWIYGPDDATVTILAVHGFRGTHHGLEPVFAQLPHIRFIAPDLPGFGETPPLPGRRHDLAAYVDWLRDFAGHFPGAIILGHSFGSIVTSAAVAGGLDTPRLILINPIGAPALEGPRGILTRLAVFYYWAGARLTERIGTWVLRSKLVVRIMSVAMSKTHDKELLKFIHDQHDEHFSEFADRSLLHDAFVTSVSNDVRASAPQITVPTLMIAAQKDDITPIEAERVLAGMFPNAELVEIADVGHLIHYEKPQIAAAAIEKFVTASS